MNRPDSIEHFIHSRRPDFDAATPEQHVWTKVEQSLARLQEADALETALLLNRAAFDTAEPDKRVWTSLESYLNETENQAPDPLEYFIRENRDTFDQAVPDLSVWANIEKQTPGKARIIRVGWHRSLLRAAAALALLVTGLSLGVWYARSSEPPVMAMSQVSNEYAELEQYFQRDIEGKQRQLAKFAGSQSAEVEQDLEQLDNIMAELQLELATVPEGNREQVVRAMIENYRAKAAILERVLERLEKSTKTKTLNSDSNNEVKNI
ncbi:MAG: hypothetical protein KIS77_08810 [Saprospiraceae bacterium]|nr:hypothetical protein [Saprospiraceae bacterium]